MYRSQLYADVVGFLLRLNCIVQGVGRNNNANVSKMVSAMVTFLGTAKDWINDIPPVNQSQRFGNQAFRTWQDKLVQEVMTSFLPTLLPKELVDAGAAKELAVYLCESFGNTQRIDYGTGHELNFFMFLACLAKLKLVEEKQDFIHLVTEVFVAYLKVVRELQTVYWLEPAGSKGAWGLDDYQFLPFLLGSSQLVDHPSASSPASIHKEQLVEELADDYLYMGSIRFLNKMKHKVHLSQHSPYLDTISQVSSWTKVNSGLIKMYANEVLGKFPIMQHVFFGAILPFAPASEEDLKPVLAVLGPMAMAGGGGGGGAGVGPMRMVGTMSMPMPLAAAGGVPGGVGISANRVQLTQEERQAKLDAILAKNKK